ncbi:lytic transglycosylase domain-containing protein [Flavobacterium sp.]|uniref:lytic transglycosylase domain-containing protein n=1 Tax=Flavobacterium sp. TaxID=239 RepID=UPI003527AF5D
MKKIVAIASVVALSSLFIFATATRIKEKQIDTSHTIYPKQMDFANENVPMHIVDVEERLDREMIVNMNYHSNTILVIKRANKVFPIIEPILAKNGVPDDFKYLAVIESSLANVTSPAGAKGIWQFMPATAKEKGLEVNSNVDERYHLEKATQAACEYLLEAKQQFGSWTLVAASYNVGMNGISRRLEEQQVSNYYDLLLPEETSRYVFRILALKEIMKNPSKYNFNISDDMKYSLPETTSITVATEIPDLVAFAKEKGINYKTLKYYNPWLREDKLNNKSGKQYQIVLPANQ